MEKITSKTNTIIKDTKKLFTSSKARRELGLFPLEGARLCFDVLNSFYSVDTVLVTEELYARYTEKVDDLISISSKAFLISNDVASKISDTPNPQGIFVTCKMQSVSQNIDGYRVIALDNVQDPSNVGAIIRTAEALGIDSIITYDCCDVFNPKALRASMGSALRMKIVDVDNLVDCLNEQKQNGYFVYSTVPNSSATSLKQIDFSKKSICVIGNEANGVEDSIKNISTDLITIPMLGRAESLNASVAASITMWEMVR